MADVEVAGVSARLGFDVDSTGAERFEARLKKDQILANQGATAKLKAEFDERGFELYERKLDESRRKAEARSRFREKLGPAFDTRAFNAAYREMTRIEQASERERTQLASAASRERVRIAAAETREETRLQGAVRREAIRTEAERQRLIQRRQAAERRANDRMLTDARATSNTLGRIYGGGGGGGGGARSFGAPFSNLGPESERGASGLRQLAYAIRTVRIAGLVTAVASAVSILGALAAAAVAAASALSPLAGLLGTIPAFAGAAAQGLGVIAISAQGVGAAVKAGLNAQARSGMEAARASTRAASAAESQRNADESLHNAENNLTNAQEARTVAQEGLTAATEDAQRRYEDLALAAKGAALNEEDALLALRRAQQEARKARTDPGSSALGAQEADLAVRQARLRLQQVRQESQRAREDYAEAQRTGVQGMPEVVSAQRSLRDAIQGVTEAHHDVATAAEKTSAAEQKAATATELGTSAANTYQAALNKLSPAQQRFAKYLVSLAPQFQKLQDAAGENLFKGVERGLRSASGNFDILQRGLVRTSGTIGKLIEQAGEWIGSRAFGRDFETQMGRNDVLIRRFGEGSINLSKAIVDVTIAAGPLVDWISRLILGWTEVIEKSAHAGRENGKLRDFFDQTRVVIDRLVRIAGDLAGALFNIAKQAYPLGSDLLRVITLNADKFREWTESAKGQNSIREYFRNARPAIDESGRLMRDMVKDFFRLGRGDRVAPLVRSLRTELLPALADVIDNASNQFAPAFVDALTQVLRLFERLIGDSGPLVIFARMLSSVLTFINHLIDRVPVLGHVIGLLIIAGGLSKALGLAQAITGFNSLIGRARQLQAIVAGTNAIQAGGTVQTVGAVGGGLGAARAAQGVPDIRGLRPGQTILVPVQAGNAMRGGGGFVGGTQRRVGTRPTRFIGNWDPVPPRIITPQMFAEQYGGVAPESRFAGPVSQLGRQQFGIARATAGLRATAAAGASTLAALLGGPIGIAIAGAVGTAIAVSANRARQNRDFQQGQQRIQQLPRLALAGDKGAQDSLKYLDALSGKTKVSDDRLRELAKRFKEFVGVDIAAGGQKGFQKYLDELRKAGGRAQEILGNLAKYKNALKAVRFQDILDPNAASQVFSSFNSIRKYGVDSIDELRRKTQFNIDEISKAFVEGSPSWSRAMTTNINLGIDAVKDAMRDGKISAGDGTKEIARLVQQNMELARDHLDKMSDVGKERLAQNFADAADAVRDQMKRAGKVTKEGMQQVRSYLEQEMQVYGFSIREARNLVKGNSFIGGPEEGTRGPGRSGTRARATGGMASPFGGGSADDHVLLDPSGRPVAALSGSEGIINEPQMRVLDYALSVAQSFGGLPWGSLDQLWGSGMRHFAGGGFLAAANRLEKAHFPYLWGGGHQKTPAPFGPMDCSGAVSYVLQQGGVDIPTMVSGQLMRAGAPGGDGITVYANPEHTFMRIGGRYFGTSATNPGGGAGWFPDPGPAYRSRFVARHFAGNMGFGGDGSIPTPQTKYGGAVGATVNRVLAMGAAAANAVLGNVASAGIGAGQTGDQTSVLHPSPSVISGFRRAIRTRNPFPIEKLSLWEAGIVESGLQNLNYGDADSLGALQERASIYGRAHALNPYASASRFLGDAARLRPWRGTAGLLAAAVQRPAAQFRGRYDQVAGQARQFLRRGGRMIPRFNGGGQIGHGGPYNIRVLRKLTSNRIGRYEKATKDLDRLQRTYTQKDREFDMTQEVLVNPDTGEIDQQQINQRLGELDFLLTLRQQIFRKLEEIQRIVRQIIETYQEIIGRLTRAKNAAKKKDRPGLEGSIAHYKGGLKEYQAIADDLPFDIEDARLDLVDIQRERAEVAGTSPDNRQRQQYYDDTHPQPEDTSGGEAGQLTPDQEALLAQAQRLKDIVTRGTFIDTSALGILGVNAVPPGGANAVGQAGAYSPAIVSKAASMGVSLTANPSGGAGAGGVVVYQTNQMLTPSDPAVLAQVGRTVTAGIGYQGLVSSPREFLGV